MAEHMYADRLFKAFEQNEPAPGSLLVAAPDLMAPEFSRSVVLILEHNPTYTLGLTLTARSEVAVDTVLPAWAGLAAAPPAVYLGGPLEPRGALAVGVASAGANIEQTPGISRVANRIVQVDLGQDPESLAGSVEGIRVFLGHAVWGPGQLAGELADGDWYVAPALPSDVVAPARRDLWGDVLRRQPMPLPLFATFPADLVDN
ncbi:YqgE/AlgH family protein [Corynebacterium otitidis]